MLRFLILIFLFFFHFSSDAQYVTIQCNHSQRITIEEFQGINNKLIIDTLCGEETAFKINPSYQKGFIRLKTDSSKIDFIITPNTSNYSFKVKGQKIELTDSSFENQLLFSTKQNWKNIENKPAYISSLLEKYQNSYFVSTFAANFPPSFYMDSLLYDNEWENIPFEDSAIVNSTLIPNRIIKSLKYNTPKNPDTYKAWIDILLKEAMVNEYCFQFTISFLSSILPRVSPVEVQEYFTNQYLNNNLCDYNFENKGTSILKTLYAQQSIYNLDLDQNFFKLIDTSNYTSHLIFIWSIECPHCHDALDLLNANQQYLMQNQIEIITLEISGNNSSNEKWVSNKKNWNNHSNIEQKWQSFLSSIGIQHTPTLFFINQNHSLKILPSIFDLFSLENNQ